MQCLQFRVEPGVTPVETGVTAAAVVVVVAVVNVGAVYYCRIECCYQVLK